MARFSGSIPPAGAWFSPDIEILPLFADRMELRVEGDAVERVEHDLAIPLDDASDLPSPRLGAGEASQRFRQAKLCGMAGGGRVDVLDGEGEFAFVAVVGAAQFGAAIDETTPRFGAVLRVEGQDSAVSERP